jgi:hypothetical protein
MSCYGYVRTNRAGEHAKQEIQRAAIAAAAEQLGHTIERYYVDDGITGTTDPVVRPGLKALLGALQAGDVFIVASADRLARHAQAALTILQWCERRGVSVHWADTLAQSRPVHATEISDNAGRAYRVVVFLDVEAIARLACEMVTDATPLRGLGVVSIRVQPLDH